jgi:hypothetical protein
MEGIEQLGASTGTLQALALALGLGWASGLRLYATVAVLGILSFTGTIELPPGLAPIAHPWVIGVAAFMFLAEFLADKIPGVDSLWDATQTFVRIPAGLLLAWAAVSGEGSSIDPVLQVLAALAGGSLAAGTHFAKAGARALINTSPEPFSNWGASIGEDALVLTGLWLCLQHPLLFLLALVVFVGLLAWALPRLARGIGVMFTRLAAFVDRANRPN